MFPSGYSLLSQPYFFVFFVGGGGNYFSPGPTKILLAYETNLVKQIILSGLIEIGVSILYGLINA